MKNAPFTIIALYIGRLGKKPCSGGQELDEQQCTHLGVPVDGVGHPATRLDLVGVQAPELELLLEERAADVRRIMQFAGPAITVKINCC